MVLTEEQVNFFFPQVKLDVEGSGYEDNEAAAEDTIDPADTAEVIASRGRIDGYQHDLEDREVLFSGQGALDRPAAFLSAVDLFSSDASAKAFLLRQLEDFRRLAGTELEEGLTLSGFEELPALGLGPNAFAGRATMKQAAFETPFTMELIAWQRGPLVARVSTIALDSENRSSAMTRLAGAMDKRIDGVLAGEITATPLVVEPAAARLGSEDAAKQAGFDLAAMMLTEADLPAGTRMTSDGYQEKSDVVSAYERDFRSGTISNISVDVELKSSTFDAMAPIQVFKAMETKAVGDLFSQAFCRPGDAA